MEAYDADVLRLLPDSHRDTTSFAIEPVPAIADSVARLRWSFFSRWSRLSGDSIGVVWTDGYHGFSFRLSGRDTLRGTVLRLTDVVLVDSTGRRVNTPEPRPTRAWRIACQQ